MKELTFYYSSDRTDRKETGDERRERNRICRRAVKFTNPYYGQAAYNEYRLNTIHNYLIQQTFVTLCKLGIILQKTAHIKLVMHLMSIYFI